jgi:multidrug efflux pump subunit AcrB
LIFSIGLLVDDAIVVIENIARHWAMNDGLTWYDAVIEAVALTALAAMIGWSVILFDPIF